MSELQLYEDYARGTHTPKKHKAEHPSARGEKSLLRIWNRIRPTLVERGVAEVPVELPKDIRKWAVMPDWLEFMERNPFKGRNVFDWLDSSVPKGGMSFRDGAMTIRRHPKDHAIARTKQHGQGLNDPRPAFTFHGNRMNLEAFSADIQKQQKQAIGQGLYPDPEFKNLDLESMDKWNSVMGGRVGSYVLAESSILFTGMTPHQESGTPIPVDHFWNAWRTEMEIQFPGVLEGGPPLKPKNLYVGVGNSRGIRIQNKEGASGWPYSNSSPDEIREMLNRPKFKGRPTKGIVFQHALKTQFDWIRKGMPMSGKHYDAMAQPATLTFRGDRTADMDLRVLGTRGPTQKYHEATDQLAALMPGRSVIIVPTCLVLAQSTWAQPLGDYIANTASPGFDWVDPAHSSERLDNFRRADLLQASDKPVVTVGADASGWDRDVTEQMHAGEAAWYCSMFPREQRLVYVDSQLPIDVGEEWIAEMLGTLQDGEETQAEVTQILSDGSEKVGRVTVQTISFDYHEYICKVMTMVNDASLNWADYVMDSPGHEHSLAPADPKFKGLSIVSNGGRRSGDAATGIGNSWSNCVIIEAYASMSRDTKLLPLRKRRAELQGESVGGSIEVEDKFTRGDDSVVRVKKLDNTPASTSVAGGMCSVGLRANADKQETSDVPGKPVFGFANVITTEKYMGKLVGRTAQRAVIQESNGLDPLALDLVLEELGDLAIEAGLMTTTSTAKSRLAPLAGFPLLDQHPIAEGVIERMVNHDKYRLVYISDDSFDDEGRVTEKGKEMLARAKQVEAKVQARLRARRENVSVDLTALIEAYEDATVHAFIEAVALDDNYVANPVFALDGTTNQELFRERVSKA